MSAETIREKFKRLVDDGDLIGIYENKDLSHPGLGHRIAFVYDGPVIAFAKVGVTKAHDGEHGPGWRYVLIKVTGDIEEAAQVLEGKGVDDPSLAY